MNFVLEKIMYIVCYTSFTNAHKTITKLIKDEFSINVSDGDNVYSSEDKNHYEDRYAYDDLETALEYCDETTDFSDVSLDEHDRFVISEHFGLNLVERPDNEIITKSVSNAIPIYLDDKITDLKTMLEAVNVSNNGKAALVKDADYMYHIEADGKILGYTDNNSSNDHCDFEQFADDLRQFMTDNFNRIVITEKNSDNTAVCYMLIDKNHHVIVDQNELINIAFNHIYDLL